MDIKDVRRATHVSVLALATIEVSLASGNPSWNRPIGPQWVLVSIVEDWPVLQLSPVWARSS